MQIIRPLTAADDDVALDIEVATRIMGYRWVEWNHAALGGAPIEAPGRFLAGPDDPIRHLYMPARDSTPQGEAPSLRVPRFSAVLDEAFRAAESAGLFDEGAAIVARGPDELWRVELLRAGQRFEGPELPAVLCRAALAWHERHTEAG